MPLVDTLTTRSLIARAVDVPLDPPIKASAGTVARLRTH